MIWKSGNSSSDKTINYSNFDKLPGNPFWNETTNELDISEYARKMAVSTIDIVVILLGTNDSISGDFRSPTGSINSARTLIRAFIDYNPNIKIILEQTPPDADTISSWHVYGDPTSYKSLMIGYRHNIFALRKAIIDLCNESEFTGNLFYGSSVVNLDRYYGFDFQKVNPPYRISESFQDVKEDFHTNSVHPGAAGYKQIGDGFYNGIMAILNM